MPLEPAKEWSEEQRIDNFAEIGTSGLRRYGGYIIEELHTKLSGPKAVKVYRQMHDNSAILGAMLYAIRTFVGRIDWWMEPAKKVDGGEKEADFISECMEDMAQTWTGLIEEALTILHFGHAVNEVTYKRRQGESDEKIKNSKYTDGKIGWGSIAMRAQETLDHWQYDEDTGLVLGMWQRAAPKYEMKFIPSAKSIHFRNRPHKNNPEGWSLFRPVYKTWMDIRQLEAIEGIGAERDLVGFPIFEVPERLLSNSATDNEKAILELVKSIIVNVRIDEQMGAVIPAELDDKGNPTGYKLRTMGGSGGKQFDLDKVIKRRETRMGMALLGGFLFTAMDKVGSQSADVNKSQLFKLALEGIADSVRDTLQTEGVDVLAKLNGIPTERIPVLNRGDIDAPDLLEFATYIKDGLMSGALTPDPGIERKYRNVGNLPEIADEDMAAGGGGDRDDDDPPDVDDPPQPPNPDDPEAPPAAKGAAKSEAVPTVDPKETLNGAQITALLDVMAKVASGEIPRESGIEVIVAGFPIKRERAHAILGELGRGHKPPPKVQPPIGGGPGKEPPPPPEPPVKPPPPTPPGAEDEDGDGSA